MASFEDEESGRELTWEETWADVEGIPQDDGPSPIATIAYSPEFRRSMDLFRAVLRTGEHSERVLNLTARILDDNAANYTVWQYRRECLRALGSDLQEELDFMDDFAEQNPKNYQIWHHRRVVVEELGDPSRELAFCAKVFRVDAKNYHAWAHRQWVIKTFALWSDEIAYIESLLELDIRNNSAWNQRWFVLHTGPTAITPESIASEIVFAFAAIDKAKNNESAWNYVRGIANKYQFAQEDIRNKCQGLVDTSEGENTLVLGLLADLWEKEGSETGLEKAIDFFLTLMEVDRVREKSWTKRKDVALIARELLN